jgi:hypothetical protein
MARRLEGLGFKVLNLHRPNWASHEIVLACALAEANGRRQVYNTDPRAKPFAVKAADIPSTDKPFQSSL